MNTPLRFLAPFVMGLSATLVACGSDMDDGTSTGACTDLAAVSVSVAVVNAAGMPVTDATLTFSVAGGPAQACENMTNGTYLCGFEQEGMITVTATKGADTATQTVTVAKDASGCHVVGQSITLTLGA